MGVGQAVKSFFGRRINERGQEVPDPTPVALPIGHKNPPPLEVRMRQMIERELSQRAAEVGFETFEEANDFEVGEVDAAAFPDEDDQFAVNDPHVQGAFEREVPVVRERVQKAREAAKPQKAKAKPAPAAEGGNRKPEPSDDDLEASGEGE